MNADLHCHSTVSDGTLEGRHTAGFNLTNLNVGADGDLSWLPAPSRPGDAVTFEADMDCVIVVSACPMDLNPINGDRPTSLAIDFVASRT